MLRVRTPAVAGRFYPDQPEALLRDVRSYVGTQFATSDADAIRGDKIRAVGCVVPHAGYMYSGHVAGAVYSSLELPRRFILIGPNHTGRGAALAIMSEGSWMTPLGPATLDCELATALKNAFPLLTEDDAAHREEHALEVQLPFLQELASDFRFTPIAVGVSQLELLEGLGNAIAAVVSSCSDSVLVIASSDMNHYESDKVTRPKDRLAIERVLELDADGLLRVVHMSSISMCGYAATVTMLAAAKRLGASSARLIRYATSGDVSGDRDFVVGYAGMAVL